jgi:hypothetical protein
MNSIFNVLSIRHFILFEKRNSTNEIISMKGYEKKIIVFKVFGRSSNMPISVLLTEIICTISRKRKIVAMKMLINKIILIDDLFIDYYIC